MPIDPIHLTVWTMAVAAFMVPLLRFTPANRRTTVLAWTLVGVAAYAAKHLLIVALPQWTDAPSDASGYVAHAEALFLHWNAAPVDPDAYRLAGYSQHWAAAHGRFWAPHAQIPYASVLGTSEWLYSALLAQHLPIGPAWPAWATGTNLLIAAMLPAASWLLAIELGADRTGAAAAAALMAIDPTTSVNASWLLKDVFTTAVAALALLAACHLLRRVSLQAMLILTLTLAVLVATRFVGFLAIACTLVGLFLIGVVQRDKPRWTPLVAVGLSLVAATGIAAYPLAPDHAQVVDTLLGRFDAANATMMAGAGERAFDPSVSEWWSRLKDNPLLAMLQAVARTLFAPYPWSVLQSPLTWDSHLELYLLGSLVWLLCLPLIGIGLVQAAQRRSLSDLLCLGTVFALTIAYILMMGEWSTRQRAFMNPLFFAFFGLGLMQVKRWLSVHLPDSKAKVAYG